MIVIYQRKPHERVVVQRVGDVFVSRLSNGLDVRSWTSEPAPDGILADVMFTEIHFTLIQFGFRPVSSER